MNWTKEATILYQWSKKEHDNSKISANEMGENSGWKEHNISSDIMEYDFENVNELESLLKQFIMINSIDEILIPLVVASFTEYYRLLEQQETNLEEYYLKEFTLPDFVYAF